MKHLKKLILFIFCLTFFNTAFALRCGNQIISIGDSTTKVLQACGKPNEKTTISKKSKNKLQSVKKTKWIYNFGSQDFIYELIFENGKLSEIDTSGYGH